MQRILLSLALFASVLAPAMYGQANNATVTGVVTDTADAVIPGAMVTVTNVDQGVDRTMETNEEGVYVIVNLAPGNYALKVETEGFRSYVQQGIVLRIGDTIRADVKMEIGAVTESITVDAQLVTLNTENGTIKGDVIVQEEIQEIPLAGRDFTDLAFFTPGVLPQPTGGQGSALIVNGARGSNTNFYVDGFDNRNARGAAAQARPNIDALQEFKMEVSGYSAEYGRMAGGVLNMALRSGTNEFHGNINYFLRNDVFDALGYFEEDGNALKQHQYAVTVAGPIIKNKTFFMVSFEGLNKIEDQTRLTRVPTLIERGGDFSQSFNTTGGRLFLHDRVATGACNANNQRACFPNNIIPAARLDPVGQNIIAYYPDPNRFTGGATGFNYTTTATDDDVWKSPLFKIDHKIGENSLAVRWQTRYNDTTNPFSGSELSGFGHTIDDARTLGGVDYTHMFSPTLLLEVRAGVSRNAEYDEGFWAGQNIAEQLGVPNLISDGEAEAHPPALDWPRFQVTNYAALGTGANMPVEFFVTDWQHGAKLSWIRGSHNIKFGYSNNFVQFNQPFYNNQRGTYNFNGVRTTNPVADLVLGWLQNVNRQTFVNRNYWRQHAIGTFFNDDWKATRKLTVNLGVRWEVNRAPWDKYDRLGSYDVDTQRLIIASVANAAPNYEQLLDQTGLRGLVVANDTVGLPRSVIKTDWLNFSPRVGLAYKVNEKTVLRTGYGLFQGGDILNNLRNNLSNQFPYVLNQQFAGVNTDPNLVSLKTPFPDSRATLTGTTNANGFTIRPQQAYLQSWNFTVERELFGGTAIEMDYRGSKGTHLQRLYDYNQPFRNLETLIAGTGFVRPIPVWNAINIFRTGTNSIYNAFNASWRKRSRGGMFWRLNYSFSKSIDDASQANGQSNGGFAGALDSRNLRLERSRSDFDRRHVVTALGSYDLPFGKGQRWGGNWNRAVDAIFGGWQLSGTATMYSGSPITIESTGVDANLGESVRPNRLREGSVDASSKPGRKGVDFPWYDLSAFEEVPCYVAPGDQVPGGCTVSQNGFQPFAVGNSGRNILDGPGLFSTDLALAKNFRIKEGHNLQLRVESFNLTNRVNFVITEPLTLFNSLTGGLVNQVGDVGRAGGPRIFQYALKYRF
jgi:hypothetical protein